MIPLALLSKATTEALLFVQAQPGVQECEVFMASNGSLFARLNYTSRIASNGLEEPKSLESYGVGLRVAFRTPEGTTIGFGSEPSDISFQGVMRALEKARRGAVRDPEFVSLPRPPGARGGPCATTTTPRSCVCAMDTWWTPAGRCWNRRWRCLAPRKS